MTHLRTVSRDPKLTLVRIDEDPCDSCSKERPPASTSSLALPSGHLTAALGVEIESMTLEEVVIRSPAVSILSQVTLGTRGRQWRIDSKAAMLWYRGPNYPRANRLPEAVLQDARDVADLLRSGDYCGYPPANEALLLDGQATADGIRQGLRRCPSHGPRGHGRHLLLRTRRAGRGRPRLGTT